MTQEQLSAFIQRCKLDPDIRSQLESATSVETVGEIAREAGLVFESECPLTSVQLVSDEEMEEVVGGRQCMNFFKSLFFGFWSTDCKPNPTTATP